MLVSDEYELIMDAIAASRLPADQTSTGRQLLFEAYEVICGVYRDEEEEIGYKLLIIKGERAMAQQRPGQLDRRKVTSLLCRDAEEVIALSKIYGDRTPLM